MKIFHFNLCEWLMFAKIPLLMGMFEPLQEIKWTVLKGSSICRCSLDAHKKLTWTSSPPLGCFSAETSTADKEIVTQMVCHAEVI